MDQCILAYPAKPAAGLAEHSDDDLLAVLPLVHLVVARVPDAHRATAVLAARDVALERCVLHWMVLGLHREVVDLGVGRRRLRYGPADQDPVPLQPKVVMQAPGVVLLNHEYSARLVTGCRSGWGCRHRLGGLGCVPHAAVLGQPVRRG